MKKPYVSIQDFMNLDLRIGEVKDAQPVEKSEKLLKLTVDFGPDYGVVTILTGMAKYYSPDRFMNRKFCFIANLEPRKMMGMESNGMLLSADEDGKPLLIDIDASVPVGLIVR